MSTPVVKVLVLAINLVWLHCLDTLATEAAQMVDAATADWVNTTIGSTQQPAQVGVLAPVVRDMPGHSSQLQSSQQQPLLLLLTPTCKLALRQLLPHEAREMVWAMEEQLGG